MYNRLVSDVCRDIMMWAWLCLSVIFWKTKRAIALIFAMQLRVMFWQSINDFIIYVKTPFFEKITKAIVHGSFKNGVSD